MSKLIVMTTGGNDNTAARLLAVSNTAKGEVYSEAFPDGETYHRLVTPVNHNESVVVGDFSSPDAVLDLFDVANLVADEGTLGLTIIVPQAGRGGKLSARDRFMQRVYTRMLAAVPDTALGNRIVAVDPASPAMPFYDNRGIKPNYKVPASVRGRVAIDLFRDRGNPIVFSTKSYGYMQEAFLDLADFEAGEVRRDADGNVLGIETDVTGRDVVVIGGTIDHAETLDLYVIANALFEKGALSLTLVVPYFGYSTMERGKPDLHEAVKASYRARLISSIPRCPLGNRTIMVDLHSEGIPHYFQNGMRTMHVYAIKQVIMKMVAGMRGGRLCTTDAGRVKWAESLVKDINKAMREGAGEKDRWKTAMAIKDRIDGANTELLGILGDVAGLDIWLFDDMIRRGTTAIDAGKGYRLGKPPELRYIPEELRHIVQPLLSQLSAALQGARLGCKGIRFVASHGVLPGNSLERLQNAVDHEGTPLFNEIVVTDSTPRACQLKGDFLKVEPISPILVEALVTSFPTLS